MTTPLQARLRPGEPELLRADACRLVNRWAAVLLGLDDVSELDDYPYAEVSLHQLSAAVLLRDELDEFIGRVEPRAVRASTHELVARAQGVTRQAVSLRMSKRADGPRRLA